MSFHAISVVICCYNSSKKIHRTLDHLAAQRYDESKYQWELIVVDNASTDGTADMVKQLWGELNPSVPLKIILEKQPGKANAVTAGYNTASHELILLCDDDNWLNPDYFSVVFELYNKHPDIGLLGGYGKEAYLGAETKPEWFDEFQFYYVVGKHHKENGFLEPLNIDIWGAGSVMRKTMWKFLTEAGFSFRNSRTVGKAITEDAELSMAITYTGHNLYFDDRLYFIHDLSGKRVSWENLLSQNIANGKCNAWLKLYIMAYAKCRWNVKSNNFYPHYIKFIKETFRSIRPFILKDKSTLTKAQLLEYVKGKSLLKELIINRKVYRKTFPEIHYWVNAIYNKKPLGN